MKIIKLLALILLTVVIICCEKEENDYRDIYYGKFNFTVIDEFWLLGSTTQYDTIQYIGEIRKYTKLDSDNDLYVDNDDQNEDPNKKITIEFTVNNIITSILSSDGELIQKSGYHYYHEGGFIASDSIEFIVTGLGGLGGGHNYTITGYRE